MTSPAKLTGPKDCFTVQSMLATAALVGAPVDFTNAKGRFQFCSASGVQADEHVVPVLRYFGSQRPELGLCGLTASDALSVDHWLSRINQIMVEAYAYCPTSGRSDAEKKKAIESLKKELDHMNKRLLHHTFLAQERISIADILAALLLNTLSMFGETNAALSIATSYPNVQRWMSTLLAQEALKKQISGSAEGKATPGKCTDSAAPAAKPTAEELEEQIEAERKARAKLPNPLDSLPASSFVLDAWKREYSNSKDLLGTSMPWFWKNIDLSGWSLWYMKYDKVAGENAVGYAASNMLSGFLQRLDNNFRKYSFAVINVIGKDTEFDIEGVWLIRGQEIPEELTTHPSYEYHTFRKLDGEKDKKLIEDFWTNDDDIQGKPIDSCKVWK